MNNDYICRIMRGERTLGIRITEGILQLQGRLPLACHRWWARRIAWLAGSVLHYREHVVTANLARSFPEKDYKELDAIRRRFYLHFATVLTETVWFGACRGPKGRERLRRSQIARITNAPVLNQLASGARQLMILQSHTGNWELIGGLREYAQDSPLDLSPAAFAVTYRPLSSPLWDSIMARSRQAPVQDLGFQGYVSTDNVLRFVLEKREQPFAYSFITDQYPYGAREGEPITFMHQPTHTLVAAAKLAVKLDMAVAYLRFECREGGGYNLSFVPLAAHAAQSDPLDLMKQYYKLLEEDLQRQPWNYLWTHKRWKKS